MLYTLAAVQSAYRDDPVSHRKFWDTFTDQVNANPTLKAHRDFVEKGLYGYGDRPYHWMWKLLVDELPSKFSMLEIGVFQGQTISLASLLARESGKQAKIVGITPLDMTGDAYATHPNFDYVARIRELHQEFNLPSPMIVKGLSFDPRIQNLAGDEGPYDLVYIDGCHDYSVVVDDITSYAPLVRPGGYLLVDDAGNNLNLPKGMIPTDFFGLPEVTHALASVPSDFKHVFAIGHNRVYRRLDS